MVSASELHSLALPLGIAAAVATGLWCLLVFGFALATRPRTPEPQPAGLEMGGPEPPAVVDLLCHGWKLGREALPATLVDLAARKVLSFQTAQAGHDEVVVSGSAPTDLTSYESQVLAHVRGLAHHGVVPCDALTTGPDNESDRWFRDFERAVIQDARARGLSRARWSTSVTFIVGAAALVPAGLASGALSVLSAQQKTDSSPVGAFFGLSLIVWLALMACFRKLRGERDTAAGLDAAGRWMGLAENLRADGTFPELPPTAVAIWDRYVAYAVAFGLAATTARAVALGSESDTEAWSAVGGQWRIVRVRYPSRIPPGWGHPPWRVFLVGLVESVALGGALVVVAPAFLRAGRRFLREQGGHQRALTLGLKAAFFGFVIVVAVWLVRAIAMLVIGLLDVSRSEPVEGQVLRLRRRTENNDGVVTHIAVDDGRDDHLRAWIPSTPPPGLRQGGWVRAAVSPRLGFVRSLELMPDPDAAVASPSASSASVGQDATPQTVGIPGLLGPAVAETSVAAIQPSRLSSLDVDWLSQLVGVRLAAAEPEGGAGFVAQFNGQDAHVTASVAPVGMGSEMYQQAARVPRVARSSVPGIGDEAIWIMRSTLVARSGDTVVTVGVRVKGLDSQERLRIAGEIAKRVLPG